MGADLLIALDRVCPRGSTTELLGRWGQAMEPAWLPHERLGPAMRPSSVIGDIAGNAGR
jgi:hypothetical protein